MRFEELKVGDTVYIREDLEVGEEYGGWSFVSTMLTGEHKITEVLFCEDSGVQNKIRLDGKSYVYTSEMVDWEKTRKLNIKELIKNHLNVGDFVYISPNAYGDKDKTSRAKIIGIGRNILEIQYVITGEYNAIPYVNIRNLKFEGGRQMWKDYGWVVEQEEKLAKEKRKERAKDILHTPINKPTDKLVYDGNTLSNVSNGIIVTRHESEPEDLEKAVMMYLLKDLGYTYTDVHKVLESVEFKWYPKDGEKFFYITLSGTVAYDFYNSKSYRHKNLRSFGNYFKTEEDAMDAQSKIIDVFKEIKDNA